MIANLPKNWNIYEGEGAGSRGEVVRRFDLIDGGGERMDPEDDHQPVHQAPTMPTVAWDVYRTAIDDMKAAHREHVASLERQLDRMSGDRWTGAAALRALLHPGAAGGHRLLDGHRIALNVEIANLSPFTWEAISVLCPKIGWADPDRRARITWDEHVQPSLQSIGIPIARDHADPIPVVLRVSGEVSRQFRGGQHLHIEPVGITLVVRRAGTDTREEVPVRLAAGPVFVSP